MPQEIVCASPGLFHCATGDSLYFSSLADNGHVLFLFSLDLFNTVHEEHALLLYSRRSENSKIDIRVFPILYLKLD